MREQTVSMPFTVEQFFGVFVAYNAAIWPAQIAAYALGLLAVAALWRPGTASSRLILATLALMWAFNGFAYHLGFFAPINSLAKVFAALFVVQAGLLANMVSWAPHVEFGVSANARTAVGCALIAYAMVIYELLGLMVGHGGMKGPLFGVAPCPTTIFTIGLLLLGRGRSVALLSAIPLLWAAIGSSAAVMLGVPEDYGLAVAGIILAAVLIYDRLPRKLIR
jgi:uncharacterized protein DUF6064